jgi:hypothetical protein
MTESELSGITMGAAIEVHRELGGAGLLEGVYEEARAMSCNCEGLKFRARSALPSTTKTAFIAS